MCSPAAIEDFLFLLYVMLASLCVQTRCFVFPPREGYTLHNIEARNGILSNKTMGYRLSRNGAVQYVCFLR